MHELKCINYSSTDSEQLFSRSTSSSSHQRRSVVTFFPEGEATLISVGIRAHRTWYCQRERSVHPLCMSGKSIIIRVGRLVSVQSSPRGARQSHVPTFQLGRVSRSLGHRQRRQVESGRWSRAVAGNQAKAVSVGRCCRRRRCRRSRQ